jgi:hypothetical protein
MNIQKLKEEIVKISDPRRNYGNLRHKLEDLIIIGLLSTPCLGEDFADMEEFGKEREEWLRKFLELYGSGSEIVIIADCEGSKI